MVIVIPGLSVTFQPQYTDIPSRLKVMDQSGVTIVNAKLGVRYTVNEHSFYGGFGTALTGEVWYQDIFRLEYRQAF